MDDRNGGVAVVLPPVQITRKPKPDPLPLLPDDVRFMQQLAPVAPQTIGHELRTGKAWIGKNSLWQMGGKDILIALELPPENITAEAICDRYLSRITLKQWLESGLYRAGFYLSRKRKSWLNYRSMYVLARSLGYSSVAHMLRHLLWVNFPEPPPDTTTTVTRCD